MSTRAQALVASEFSVEIQVWSLPEAVVVGEPYMLKAGVKSSAEHDLCGGTIEVCDHAGAVVASATLNAAPWPETSALYWTELTLTAPTQVGACTWSARYKSADAERLNASASCEFCLPVVARPQHTLKVKVMDKVTIAPIEDAIVRWGAFRTSTDARGQAELKVPKGTHDLIVWKAGFDVPVNSVAIDHDIDVVISAASVPEEDPDAAWKM